MAFPNLLNMFKGKAGGSQMNPGQQQAQTRVDDYRSKNWAADDTIDMSLWNNQQSDDQNTAMFGQNGDVKKQMGSIWDQIKTGAGKASKQFSEDYDYNYKKRFGNPEAAENPYSPPKRGTYENEEIIKSNNTPSNVDADGNNIPDLIQNPDNSPKTTNALPEGVDTDGNKIPDLIQAPGKFGHGKTADGQDVMYPAGKNFVGGKTDPITRGFVDDMSQNFIMGGFGGGGFGSVGKSAKKGILGLYNKFKGGY